MPIRRWGHAQKKTLNYGLRPTETTQVINNKGPNTVGRHLKGLETQIKARAQVSKSISHHIAFTIDMINRAAPTFFDVVLAAP